LSILRDIPEDISEVGNDEPFDLKSNNDEHIPVTSSSVSKNDDLQDARNTLFGYYKHYFGSSFRSTV